MKRVSRVLDGLHIQQAGSQISGGMGQAQFFAHIVPMGVNGPSGELEHGRYFLGTQSVFDQLSQP